MNKIELLAPAGDMERLQMAVAYGADAVYLAGDTFGMRSFAGNFSPEELKTALALCRAHGVRVHVTCNTMPRNGEVAQLPEYLEYLDAIGADAVIAGGVDVIVFAQGSMAYCEEYIAEKFGKVVVSSPRFGAAELKKALMAKGAI